MAEPPQHRKWKRESKYPRVTFDTGTRTFDRLLKESTLDELKDAVKNKLGYPSHVSLQLAQLRDGKLVDLEDEDDFEAFCSTAYTLPVITVRVTASENASRATPADSTPASSRMSSEPPKKRNGKRKLLEKSPIAEEPTQGQKRKASTSDTEDWPPEAEEPQQSPKKKRRRKRTLIHDTEVEHPVTEPEKDFRSNGLSNPAPRPTVELKAMVREPDLLNSKKKKDKVKAQSTPDGEPSSPAPKPTDLSEGLPIVGKKSGLRRAQPSPDPVVEGVLIEVEPPRKRKKEAWKEAPTTQKMQVAQPIEGAVKKDQEDNVPEGVNENPTKKMKTKAKAKDLEPEESENIKDAGKKMANGKIPKPRTITDKEPAMIASSLPLKGKGLPPSHSDSETEEESESAPAIAAKDIRVRLATEPVSIGSVAETQPERKGKQASTGHTLTSPQKAGTIKANDLSKAKAGKTSAAKNKAAAPVPINSAEILSRLDEIVAQKVKKRQEETSKTPSSAKALEPEPKAKTAVSEPVAKPAAGDCPICGKDSHTRSRCMFVRSAVSSNVKVLDELKAEQDEAPNDFRARQIKEIEAIIEKKRAKDTGVPKKGRKAVSNETNGVTDLAAETSNSVASARAAKKLTTTQSPQDTPTSRKGKETPPTSPQPSPQKASSKSPDRLFTVNNGADPTDENGASEPIFILQGLKDLRAHPDALSTAKDLASAINQANSRPISIPAIERAPVLSAGAKPPPRHGKDGTSSREFRAGEVPATKMFSFRPVTIQTPAKLSKAKYGKVLADPSSDDASSDDTPPPPIPPLISSHDDFGLEAVIRGPDISITTRDLPSSDSSDETDDEEKEELAHDNEEDAHRNKATKKSSGDISSSNEQSDESGQISGGTRLSLGVDREINTSAPSTPVEHGNLTFGDMNGLASSVEIDAQGDRAFSEALADDTAVFNLAANPDTSREPSCPATPEIDRDKLNSRTPHGQHDSIEPFDTPEKNFLESPIAERDAVRPTPLGSLTQRVRGKTGKTPAPLSKMDRVIMLLDSVQKGKAGESSNFAPPSSVIGKTKVANVPGKGKVSKAQPQPNKKPPRKTRSSKSSPTMPLRSAKKTNTQETQNPGHAWQVLHPDDSSQGEGEGETNMEDELQSDADENPLFIPSETQNSFPYSQWQGGRNDSPHDSEDEDEVENTIFAKQAPSKKLALGYTGLSHLATQRRSFRTSLPIARPKPTDRKKGDLYGQMGDNPSDGFSDSDSASDAKSHIPKSRRAGWSNT